MGIDSDEFGNDAKSSADRVTAWASTWRIRQFQFFGVPPVSQWRELRRLTPEQLPNGLVKKCCEAADCNDWYQYMELMGGSQCKKIDIPLTLLKVWTDDLGRYGEPKGFVTKGIEHGNISYVTRIHTWSIEPKRVVEVRTNDQLKVEAIYPPQGRPTSQSFDRGAIPAEIHPLEYCQ